MKICILMVIIYCASAQTMFLTDMMENFKDNQRFVNNQQLEAQRLLEFVQDLQAQSLQAVPGGQAAAATTSAADIQQALSGTLQWVQQWQTFTGGLITAAGVEDKIKSLQGLQDSLTEGAGQLATEALLEFNEALFKIDKAVRSIQSLATQLVGGAENVKFVMEEVMRSPTNELTGDLKLFYQSGLDLFIGMLERALRNSNTVSTDLGALIQKLGVTIGKMQAVQAQLRLSANGEGEAYTAIAVTLRLSVYGAACGTTCIVAGVFPESAPITLPACITCYIVAIPTLEVTLANWRATIAQTRTKFIAWAEFMNEMEGKTVEARNTATFWYGQITRFEDNIQVALDFSKFQRQSTYITDSLQRNFVNQIDKLINQSNALIKETKTRLVGTAIGGFLKAQSKIMSQKVVSKKMVDYKPLLDRFVKLEDAVKSGEDGVIRLMSN